MVGAALFYRVSVKAGSAEYDVSNDLSSFTIEQREMKPDLLKVHLSDPFKVVSHAVQEGMDIEVELGTESDHGVIFRGRIYQVHGTFPPDGPATLDLTAFDGSMRMGLRKRSRVFSGKTLSSIVTQIAQDASFREIEVNLSDRPASSPTGSTSKPNGAGSNSNDVTFEPNGIRQHDETDLAFLLRLAKAYGCVMFVAPSIQGECFHFVTQYSVMTAKPEVALYHGRCDIGHPLLRFHVSTDATLLQVPRVLSGISYDTGKAIEISTAELKEVGERDDVFFDENLTALRRREPDRAEKLTALASSAPQVRDKLRTDLGGVEHSAVPTFTTEKQLEQLANIQFSTSLYGMRATGATAGLAHLRARSSVRIADVGGRFSGTWYLAAVRHTLNRNGYQTEFECRR